MTERLRRTSAQWAELCAQYTASGLSQQAFCQLNGIALSTFKAHWQSFRQQQEPSAFVQAHILPSTEPQEEGIPSHNEAMMEMTMGGVTLSIPTMTPADYVATLLKALA